MLIYQFTRPFAFRHIKHAQLSWINTWLPLAGTIILVLCYWFLPVQPPLFGDRSITAHSLSVLALLPGFFIAALAAVATFQKSDLDEIMPNPSPTLLMRTGGEAEDVALTHRMFLCHLFSYLTVLAFSAIAVCVFGDLLAPSVNYFIGLIGAAAVAEGVRGTLEIIFLVLLVWLISNLAVVTLYGLYFLVERIHRPHA